MENNTLIVEFMGNPTIFNPIHDTTLYQVKEQGNMAYYLDELQYHNSWDWLIPVIEKIDDELLENPKLDCSEKIKDITIKNDFMDIRYKFANMEEVYHAVIEFIKDYNNGKQ